MRTIAYTMSRFPKLSETFILYEIVELERAGVRVEIFPLLREHEAVAHPEAGPLAARAHYAGVASAETLAAQLYWLLRRPAAYLRAWLAALWGNRGSPKFLSRALLVVPQAARFARRMRELGVEHLHAHYATHPALAAYVAHILTGIPYSVTAHAHDIYVERSMLDTKLRAASLVVAISEYNRRLIGELCGPEVAAKTAVVHCGVDFAVFRPRPARAPGGPFTIVCVASLQDYKGHSYLLEACAQLREAGMSFRCLCVGEGEHRPQLEAQIAELGLQQQVLLLGRQPRERVSALLAEADVAVQPSVVTASGKMEGIPVALMEALACGLPAVATRISGIPELIRDGETGLLVPERDSAALAEALLRLQRDPALGERLGAAGRELVEREFSLRANAARLRALIERAAASPAGAADHFEQERIQA
jgi:colanic acid/amylovoran biosynthesis glycosyltransferase